MEEFVKSFQQDISELKENDARIERKVDTGFELMVKEFAKLHEENGQILSAGEALLDKRDKEIGQRLESLEKHVGIQ